MDLKEEEFIEKNLEPILKLLLDIHVDNQVWKEQILPSHFYCHALIYSICKTWLTVLIQV